MIFRESVEFVTVDLNSSHPTAGTAADLALMSGTAAPTDWTPAEFIVTGERAARARILIGPGTAYGPLPLGDVVTIWLRYRPGGSEIIIREVGSEHVV